MNDLEPKVLELDIAYLSTFTNKIITDWGYIFYNEDQPMYYDANHAHIYDVPANPTAVIEEVLQFFQTKNIPPRFYLYNLKNQEQLLETLKDYQFKIEEFISPVQIWDQKVRTRNSESQITFERVTETTLTEALDIECSIKEFGGREVREKAYIEEFHHPLFSHYLLRKDGIACATACLVEHNHQGRLESVATLEEFRGQGLIGELIYFIQREAKERNLKNLWIFPINETIEKVYVKYGFETLGKFTHGHAYLSGKSITEIREG
ncbi:GNAT family N-acetyltransferase [Anaerobacillus alkaliphilus]|uniref:GNAT family N-acetyltransferase n=2 Tax=Anaerobacillus alkaliphilus TaxID=1548597 RepID=A0A4Q0VMT2_9BACI|nr:GNAT family N-acetyltransferase [Anaerobacillus alkaliphilus]